jgi:hypothetical protein
MLPEKYIMTLVIILGVLAAMLPMSVRAADDWQFLLAPYVWFAGAEGHLTPAPGFSATGIDVGAIEALQDTEASFMLLFEAKKKQHGLLFDVFYSDVLQESDADSEYGLPYRASLKNTMITTGYTYELYSTAQAMINLVGGLRYWKVDTQLALGTGSAQQTSLHDSESWVDPLVGVDTKFRLDDSPVYLSGFIGAGGASGGSDSFYDMSAHIAYQVTNNMFASAGYRLFDVNYEQDSFVYDVKQQGWVLGLVWVLGTPKLSRPVSGDVTPRLESSNPTPRNM